MRDPMMLVIGQKKIVVFFFFSCVSIPAVIAAMVCKILTKKKQTLNLSMNLA